MISYRAAVCDDDSASVSLLSALVRKWAESRQVGLTVDGYESAEALFAEYGHKSYDILLLDIEMKGLNGVELARRVRRLDSRVQIVFVTGYMDYIADGYEVDALHYLLKPVDREKLFAVLDKARSRLRLAEAALVFSTAEGVVRLPLRQIVWAEAFKNYVVIHAGADYTVRKTLTALESELDARFFRAGRSLIVNLNCVRRVSRSEIQLDGGVVLPLARGLYEPLSRAIIKYV